MVFQVERESNTTEGPKPRGEKKRKKQIVELDKKASRCQMGSQLIKSTFDRFAGYIFSFSVNF